MTIDELEESIDLYGRDVYAFCKQLTCNQSEAEDLYQDTFLKATEIRDRIDDRLNPKSYLLSIAMRIWKNKKRKYAWRKRIADTRAYVEETDGADTRDRLNETNSEAAAPQEQESLEELVLSREEKNIVRKTVSTLPDKYRIVVLLSYMEELSLQEISRLTDLPEGTVKSRLHTARKLLKKKLEVLYSEA